jgi:hypothetical protein
VEKALDWLAGAQQDNGGWGGGSHSAQHVKDARAVPTDPATTAVAGIALLRAGNTLERGDYAATLRRATDYLLQVVESSKEAGPQITEQTGTQPQAKMGQNVDTALTAQFLARLLQDLGKDAALRPRVVTALDKCMDKIEKAQTRDGSWAAGGWAPVLQTAQMSTALEMGQLAGGRVDNDKLALAREYQRNVGPATAGPGGSARLATDPASVSAGVPLYASAANMRGVAAEAKAASEIVEEGKKAGRVAADAKVEEKTLRELGVSATRAGELIQSFAGNNAAKERSFDERLLSGFGNNGGEEFLSFQMKSEALAIDAGEEWSKWNTRLQERLARVQNPDGSWSGHHCITSPVFCTATAISSLTADRDVAWLQKASKLARK